MAPVCAVVPSAGWSAVCPSQPLSYSNRGPVRFSHRRRAVGNYVLRVSAIQRCVSCDTMTTADRQSVGSRGNQMLVTVELFADMLPNSTVAVTRQHGM